MTNHERRYKQLKEIFKNDSRLEELLDLHVKLKLNQMSVMNDKGIDTTGVVKEIAGVTALSIELFTEEAQEE